MVRMCDKCSAEVALDAKFCRSCGTALAPMEAREAGLAPTRPSPAARPTPAYPPHHAAPVFYKNPGIATLLSFFWMGAGQVYNGEIAKGVAFIVMYVFSILLMFVLIGFITTPILWIVGMVDANASAKRINRGMAQGWRE